MARTRVIKPEFWIDAKIGEIPRDSKLLFIGLWCLSDDYGVVRASEKYIKGQLFPYDDCQANEIKDWLLVLEKKGMIIKFDSNGESYYYIKTFSKHQKIHNPSKARNPEPPKDILRKIPRNSEVFGKFRLETETETEFKQKIETETNTTSAASDEKTDLLPPEENESSGVQPDMLTEQPAKTSGDLAPQGKECARITVEVSTGSDPPTDTAQRREVYKERIVEIVDYFNQKAGTSYKHDTPETVKYIVARLRCGFTVDDFKAVIDKKTAQWKDDPKMQAYLRPITLFSTKFESYLNERIGVVYGRFGNSKPPDVGETEKLKGKYADQVDEVIYTDA